MGRSFLLFSSLFFSPLLFTLFLGGDIDTPSSDQGEKERMEIARHDTARHGVSVLYVWCWLEAITALETEAHSRGEQ